MYFCLCVQHINYRFYTFYYDNHYDILFYSILLCFICLYYVKNKSISFYCVLYTVNIVYILFNIWSIYILVKQLEWFFDNFSTFCQKRCLFWPSVCPLCWVLQLPAPPELVPWWMEKDGEQNQYLYPTVYIYKGLYRQNILSIQCLFHFVYGISNIFYIMKPIHYSVANPMP